MKKSVLLIVLLVLSQLHPSQAQRLTASPDSMFFAPDTVCINQPVTLESNVFNASSYFWGFCSGYLMDPPTGQNLGKTYSFQLPTNIDIVKDSLGNYYGFALNAADTQFLRLNFGTSLNNIPSVTNFGNLNNGLPIDPSSLFIIRDTFSGNWYVFVSGGFSYATSQLARIDFGPSLNNPTPNIANFGNYQHVLDGPKGIFIAEDANNHWFGYLVNRYNSHLIQLDFSFNISNTPVMNDFDNPNNALNTPVDMAGIYDQGQWYLFAVNQIGGNSYTPGVTDSGNITRINLGTTLDTPSSAFGAITSVINNGIPGEGYTNFNYRLIVPSSISLNRDCGDIYAYVTDSTSSQLIGIQMPYATGPYKAIDYNNVGGMNQPSCISSVLRDGNGLFAFITNAGDSSLTQIDFQACDNASIPTFTEVSPPVYSYDSPGVYNVYYVINQGLPTMRVDCKAITVLPYPSMYLSHDTTLCQGDTLHLYAVSDYADSIRWTSTYNIDTNNTYTDSVRVYPLYSTGYGVVLYYPDGCIVDTSVAINVSNVYADAGPDRYITDGASTVLGGPNTTTNVGIDSFYWSPFQFLSDSAIPNPVATPPYDYTYYLTVTELNDGYFCESHDTVIVHVSCADFTLPNAFDPTSESSATNTFGILNNQIATLNYFRIFNRWGQEVFQTSDASKRWDGTFNGKPAPCDVYVWEADGFCTSGLKINKKGNVTLLR